MRIGGNFETRKPGNFGVRKGSRMAMPIGGVSMRICTCPTEQADEPYFAKAKVNIVPVAPSNFVRRFDIETVAPCN